MEDKRQIGKKIKQLRKRLSLTQDTLAESVQISPKYLSNIEQGKENPTLDILIRLSTELKVDIGEVFAFEQDALTGEGLREKAAQLLKEASDEQLRTTIRVLQAVLH